MMVPFSRREFIQQTSMAVGATGLLAVSPSPGAIWRQDQPLFRISLAQWSLHRTLRSGKLDNLDFARTAHEEFGIQGVEYVNTFFKDKAADTKYLDDMKTRAEEHGVTSLLIMVDGEGQLGHPQPNERRKAVANHHKWADAAKHLGCHSIRVNAASQGSFDDQVILAVDGLGRLSEYASKLDLNVIVENHGGLSSNGSWLARVIEQVRMKNCGTLPDFGNFNIGRGETYDRYKGVTEMMPFAKAVSAKSHDFGEDGRETTTDFSRMMKIVLDAGYRGWVGIEYEGSRLDEYSGIRATKTLLERVRNELTPAYQDG